MEIQVKVINKSNNNLPKYETQKSAGCDVRADFSRIDENPIKVYGDCEIKRTEGKILFRIGRFSRAIIPTGLFTAIPEGYEVQLRSRSGLSIKQGLTLINGIGTIDSDFRNEWGVPVINLGLEDVWIEDGERICQAVLGKFERIEWDEVKELDETDRKGGFGHTGLK